MAPCQSGEEPYFFLGYITSSPSQYFNPRAPYGARPFRRADRPSRKARNFNPRAPYGARLSIECDRCKAITISIHAPHTGRDPAWVLRPQTRTYFNPRAPYGARRHMASTAHIPSNFNPRAPYGARPPGACRGQSSWPISIHAPHTGRDRASGFRSPSGTEFQSTRPIRGATSRPSHPFALPPISIHAPHTGRDDASMGRKLRDLGISIHAPHTGRDYYDGYQLWHAAGISIHAPHTGRDHQFLRTTS